MLDGFSDVVNHMNRSSKNLTRPDGELFRISMNYQIWCRWSHLLICLFVIQNWESPSAHESMLLLTCAKAWSCHYDVPSVAGLNLLPESAVLFLPIDWGHIRGDLVPLEILRVVCNEAMTSGVNKSPHMLSLGLMSFKHPFLLITNPVVILNKGKFLSLESFVSFWSLVSVVVVYVSMCWNGGFDIWLNCCGNECCSAVIVTNKLDLSIFICVS